MKKYQETETETGAYFQSWAPKGAHIRAIRYAHQPITWSRFSWAHPWRQWTVFLVENVAQLGQLGTNPLEQHAKK